MIDKYKCCDCGHIFTEDEADTEYTSYEDEYGVGHLFPSKTPLSFYICPHCGSDDLEEYFDDEDYEEEEE